MSAQIEIEIFKTDPGSGVFRGFAIIAMVDGQRYATDYGIDIRESAESLRRLRISAMINFLDGLVKLGIDI